jgi:hypothetical protein
VRLGVLHQVYVDEDDELRVENGRPLEMLLDPAVNADVLAGPRTRTRPEPRPLILRAKVSATVKNTTSSP